MFGTQNLKQRLGRHRANQPLVVIHDRYGNHVEAHGEYGNLLLIILIPDGLMLRFHDLANPAFAVSEKIVNPNDSFETILGISDEHRVRTFKFLSAKGLYNRIHWGIKRSPRYLRDHM